MTKIDDKWVALKHDGVDLGPPLAAEQDAGFGGALRRYQRGNIYYHPVMGGTAREVHGAILATYLAQGGPGTHPQSGQRRLGFPLSDEADVRLGGRVSRFESGAIYWVPGRGGVTVYGRVYASFHRIDLSIGLPVTEPVAVAGGDAVYFQHGCLWVTSEVPDGALVSRLKAPTLGRPRILDTKDPEGQRFRDLVTWDRVPNKLYDALVARRPSVFADIWRDRLALTPVLARGKARIPVQLSHFAVTRFNQATSVGSVALGMDVRAGQATKIAAGTLYDLSLILPGPPTGTASTVLSPHAFYAASQWENFGILHVTDLHLSVRNERFRNQLISLGMTKAASGYANFQDSLRAFCTYANRLHDKGLAQVVIATGDLVDYVYESGDSESAGGNFSLFERMLRGEIGTEELRIPIFTVLGNHDYRLHPYTLRGVVDISPGPTGSISIDQHAPHNLTPKEAEALQGGKVIEVSKTEAVRMVQAASSESSHFDYYRRRICGERNYTVKLGPHQIVMIDTGPDLGAPEDASLITQGIFLWKSLTNGFSENELRAQEGSPNSAGSRDAIGLVRDALARAGNGLVILGMHAPPFSPPGGEYPYYARETQHPTADPAQVPKFLIRRGATPSTPTPLPPDVALGGWTLTQSRHFKSGPVEDKLDFGIAKQGADELVRLAAGEGVPRPVDVILCGHQHDRVDYRFRLDPGTARVQFFMDFYTENPWTYYWSTNNIDDATLKVGHPVHITVRDGAPLNGQRTITRDHRGEVPTLRAALEVPSYATPLDTSTDAASWWRSHRPLALQTGPLGPVEHRQRFDPLWRRFLVGFPLTEEAPQRPSTDHKPLAPDQINALFRGFRLLQVEKNVIDKIRYITLEELRARGSEFPWEADGSPSGGPAGSKTPTHATVPHVKEDSPATARATIRGAGLIPAFTKTGTFVLHQSPLAGAVVALGSTVTCELSKAPIQ